MPQAGILPPQSSRDPRSPVGSAPGRGLGPEFSAEDEGSGWGSRHGSWGRQGQDSSRPPWAPLAPFYSIRRQLGITGGLVLVIKVMYN